MHYSDCDNGNDEQQHYCGMYTKSFQNTVVIFFLL